MDKRIKETFDNIHAEDDLKKKTKAFLSEKTHSSRTYNRLIPVAVCFLFIFIGLGGYHVYFTPASVISIDINPSIELEVNRFDKVISIESFNKDGDRLAESLDVRFLNYVKALEQILNNDNVEAYLSRNELLSIAVIGSDETRNSKMLSHIESCTAGHKNTHCSSTVSEHVEDAHESGMSCGKYKAYLELQELNPDITTEEVQGMTMKEIQNLIDSLSPNASSENQDGADNKKGHDRQEEKHGHNDSKGKHDNGHN